MAILNQDPVSALTYIGWYGKCDTCEDYDLTNPSTRSKIVKILQTTSDNKNYIKFDATIDSIYDDINTGIQDFTTLRCGYSYIIILKLK